MGRRGDHSREELKAMIIKAAREIVSERGISNLSTRKITAKIGYSVGTLYHIFSNLDDIILHVNSETLDLLYRDLKKYKEKGSNLQATLQKLAHCYLNFSNKHSSEWRLLFEYPFTEVMIYPNWYQEKITKLFYLIEEVLQDKIKCPQKILARTSRLLWSGIHGICSLAHTGKLQKTQSDPAEKLVDEFIVYFLAGFKVLYLAPPSD